MLEWRPTVVKASNKELLAKQNLILQPSIHYDHCKVGIPSKLGGFPEWSHCQMNGSVFSPGLWLEVINAFADMMTYYCDGYCMIMELSLVFLPWFISLHQRHPQILEKHISWKLKLWWQNSKERNDPKWHHAQKWIYTRIIRHIQDFMI